MVKKLIVFIWAAVIVSCSPQETFKAKPKEPVKKESKKRILLIRIIGVVRDYSIMRDHWIQLRDPMSML